MTQAASPFMWGAGGARMTPEQIAKQREIAEAMIARGVDTSPVGHWTQGAARVAQALFGSIGASRADAAEKESMERSRAMLMGAIGGDSAADTPAPGAVATSTGPTDAPGDLGAYAKAIQSIESGGKYDIVGPTHPRYGRALGAYQVMEANLPEWSKAALGRVVTPDEFLKSREVQDQVFQHRFGGYLNRFGNPQDAASAWFTGQPLAKGANRRDVLGTTGSGYVDKFNRFLGRNAADLPAPGASPTSMPGAGEGFAVPTQGVAETEDDVRRMELATGMRPPSDMETLFAPQQMPGAPAFQPATAPAPSMTMAPVEPGVGMPPQRVAAPLPPPRPADLPAPGAREAVAQAMMPQTGVYGRSGDGSEWELYQYEDDNGRIMYGTRARGAANSPGQSLAPADTPGAGVLTGQGGGIARVAQAMMGGGGQATAAPVAAPAGAPPAGGAPAASGGRAQQLIMLATDPTVPGSVRQVAMALYQQEAEKNKPVAPVSVAPGAALVDPRTGREVYRAPPRDELSPDERRYNRYAAEERAAGRQPVSETEWARANKSASATRVSIDGGGSDKQVFDNINESAKAAQSAVQGLSSIKTARDAVMAGGIFGAGADMRLGLAKLGAFFGMDAKAVENTETFRSAIAPQVAALMKATVGSTQISNADREFAEKAAGGSINLDEKSILRLLNVMEKASRAAVASHRDRLNKVYPERPDGRFERERALFGVPELPEEPAPPPAYEAVNPQTGERMISDDGKTWRKP